MIDADAFDKALANAQAECKKNGGNFRFGVLSNVRANIADAPTIDAIPVEWLEKKRKNLMLAAMVHSTVYGDNSIELCHAVNQKMFRACGY